MAEISNSANGARGDKGMLKRCTHFSESNNPQASQSTNQTLVRGADLHQADFSEMGGHPNLRLTNLKIWQGWKESNLRMPESKSGALTNLATPLHGTVVVANNRPINHLFQKTVSKTVLFIPT